MRKHTYAFLTLPLMLLGSLANAQTAGTITFTANQTSATGSLAPRLTWSTSPVASSCVAGGGWSGTKFASGSETLPTITASTSYTLTCTWNNGSATINWVAPTRNIDGTTLRDLADYKVVYGTSQSNLSNTMMLNNPSATTATIGSLSAGRWYFAVRAVNSVQAESNNSNLVMKDIAAATASRTLGITITPVSNPPPTNPPPTGTLRTADIDVYDVVIQNGVPVRGRVIGTVAIGVQCYSDYRVGTNYWRLNIQNVRVRLTPRSSNVVGYCRPS
jgi:hypothetical protein